ncbi:MAG: hypothetical protein ACLQFR_10020 [Streptosporangiaceae bacterium]
MVEAEALSADLQSVSALDEIDIGAWETRRRNMREVMADRQRYTDLS